MWCKSHLVEMQMLLSSSHGAANVLCQRMQCRRRLDCLREVCTIVAVRDLVRQDPKTPGRHGHQLQRQVTTAAMLSRPLRADKPQLFSAVMRASVKEH